MIYETWKSIEHSVSWRCFHQGARPIKCGDDFFLAIWHIGFFAQLRNHSPSRKHFAQINQKRCNRISFHFRWSFCLFFCVEPALNGLSPPAKLIYNGNRCFWVFVCVCLDVCVSYEIRFPTHHSTKRWHAFTGMLLTLNMLIALLFIFQRSKTPKLTEPAPSCLKMHQIFNFTLHVSRTRLTLNGWKKNTIKEWKRNTMNLTISFDRTDSD